MKIIKKEHIAKRVNSIPSKKKGNYSELEEETENNTIATYSDKYHQNNQ